MNIGGGVVGFQLDTLVIHLVCLPKLLLVSQGLTIKGALTRTLLWNKSRPFASAECTEAATVTNMHVCAPEHKERSPLHTWGTS